MRYGALLAAGVVVLLVLVLVAWSRGEAGTTTLHAAGTAPPTLPLAAPAPSPAVAWRTRDVAAIGDPQYGGTVVVHGTHTVRGRSARTGRTTWSYTRSDRTVCTAAQLEGVTIAVYELAGNCDEVTGLDSGTGDRLWTRTLDMDGKPVNGVPAFSTVTGGADPSLLVTTPLVIYALDPISGQDRWSYYHYGCRIERAVPGTSGTLISQNCSKPRCTKVLKYCGRGPQLLLRSWAAEDNDKKKNPDKITWDRMGDTDVPVSADGVISSLDTLSGVLRQHAEESGEITTRTPLSAAAGQAVTAVPAAEVELVWVDGRVYAVAPGQRGPLWHVPATAPPTVASAEPAGPASLGAARITVPLAGGAGVVDGDSGRVTTSISLTGLPAGARVHPLGSGLLATAPTGTVAYR